MIISKEIKRKVKNGTLKTQNEYSKYSKMARGCVKALEENLQNKIKISFNKVQKYSSENFLLLLLVWKTTKTKEGLKKDYT